MSHFFSSLPALLTLCPMEITGWNLWTGIPKVKGRKALVSMEGRSRHSGWEEEVESIRSDHFMSMGSQGSKIVYSSL